MVHGAVPMGTQDQIRVFQVYQAILRPPTHFSFSKSCGPQSSFSLPLAHIAKTMLSYSTVPFTSPQIVRLRQLASEAGNSIPKARYHSSEFRKQTKKKKNRKRKKKQVSELQ